MTEEAITMIESSAEMVNVISGSDSMNGGVIAYIGEQRGLSNIMSYGGETLVVISQLNVGVLLTPLSIFDYLVNYP